MKTDYGSCGYCGGKVVERRVTMDLRVGGHLHEFENVPVGRCTECGERIFKVSVAKQLDHLARARSPVKRRISVPVLEYVSANLTHP
jgi:YgiT-type zinc finger domain-containing protein